MLEKLFTSRTRVKLLTLFLLNPGKAFYLREIARTTDENVNAVRRELFQENISISRSFDSPSSSYPPKTSLPLIGCVENGIQRSMIHAGTVSEQEARNAVARAERLVHELEKMLDH